MKRIHYRFDRLATWITKAAGHPYTFMGAFLIVILWFAFGPYFEWSSDYQLYINTGTTIVTFLMLFVLQNSSNRSSDELLDEISELKKMIRDLKDGNK